MREWGDEAGRPLIFLHSLGPSSSAAFLGLASEPLVRAGFHLVAMDLPGFGASPEVRADEYDVGNLAELAWAAADAYGVDRTVIMGHSWGGAIGCLATALHPDRVEALVLVDSGHLDWGDSDPGDDHRAPRTDAPPPPRDRPRGPHGAERGCRRPVPGRDAES